MGTRSPKKAGRVNKKASIAYKINYMAGELKIVRYGLINNVYIQRPQVAAVDMCKKPFVYIAATDEALAEFMMALGEKGG